MTKCNYDYSCGSDEYCDNYLNSYYSDSYYSNQQTGTCKNRKYLFSDCSRNQECKSGMKCHYSMCIYDNSSSTDTYEYINDSGYYQKKPCKTSGTESYKYCGPYGYCGYNSALYQTGRYTETRYYQCEPRGSSYSQCYYSHECRQGLECKNGYCKPYTSDNLTGIIIGCSVGGLFLFILAVILIVAQRKRSRRLAAKRAASATAVSPQPPFPSSYTTPTPMHYQHQQHTSQPVSGTYSSPSHHSPTSITYSSPNHHSPTSITTPNTPSAPPMDEPPPPYKK